MPWTSRRRVTLVVCLAVALCGAALAIPAVIGRVSAHAGAPPRASRSVPAGATPAGKPTPPPGRPTLRARPVAVTVPGFVSWALLDRGTGRIDGSDNSTATNTTESMVKVWIVADLLRRADERGGRPDPDALERASLAIRDSNDDVAQNLYLAGGGDAVIARMIVTCGLTESVVHPGWWSMTLMTAADAVRLGACVADGRAAGRHWTPWVLNEMRNVRGGTAAVDQTRDRRRSVGHHRRPTRRSSATGWRSRTAGRTSTPTVCGT